MKGPVLWLCRIGHSRVGDLSLFGPVPLPVKMIGQHINLFNKLERSQRVIDILPLKIFGIYSITYFL